MPTAAFDTERGVRAFHWDVLRGSEQSSQLFSREKRAGTWLVIIVTLSFWGMVAFGLGAGA